MPGYLTPPIESGNRGWLETVKLLPPDPDNPRVSFINPAINTIGLLWLPAHGWTRHDSSGHPGTKANSVLTFLGIPFHGGADGGFSQVPGGGGSGEMGEFDNHIFVFWDSFSTMGGPGGHGDVDPTNSFLGIVGVPLGHDANGTIENFLGKLAGNTNYSGSPNFDMDGHIVSADIIASGDLGDPDPPYGPSFNDPQWSPSGANAAGRAPRGGGWYLLSSPAPNTGDFMRLWIYEDIQGNCAVQIRFLDDPDFDCDDFPLAQKKWHFTCNPYQLSMQVKDGEASISGDSFRTNNFYIASCLFVPDEFKAGISNASFVSADLGNKFQTKTNTAILVNGTFKQAWTQIAGDVFGVSFPLIDVGTLNVDANSSALKPVEQAPVVSIAIANNAEGYIAGALWDSYFTMHRYTYEQRVHSDDKPSYIAWIQDTETLHLTEATLWINSTNQ